MILQGAFCQYFGDTSESHGAAQHAITVMYEAPVWGFGATLCIAQLGRGQGVIPADACRSSCTGVGHLRPHRLRLQPLALARLPADPGSNQLHGKIHHKIHHASQVLPPPGLPMRGVSGQAHPTNKVLHSLATILEHHSSHPGTAQGSQQA